MAAAAELRRARKGSWSYGGPGSAVGATAGLEALLELRLARKRCLIYGGHGSALGRAARNFIEPARKPARLAAGPSKAQEHKKRIEDLS